MREINQDPVFHRILDKLYESGRTDKELLKYLDLANGSMTQWKYRRVKSYMKYVNKIAEFLGTTKYYLLNGELRNSEDLTIEEKDFLKKFRTLNECTRKSIIEIVNKFYSLDENYTTQSERLRCSNCPGLPAQS